MTRAPFSHTEHSAESPLAPLAAHVDVSIVIVNWNTEDLLRDCLASLVAATSTLGVQIIVVDNGSTDGSVVMMETDFPYVQIIRHATNQGFAAANNHGLREATGRYLLLLNSDTIVPPTALDTLISYMDAHPSVGAVGPRLVNADGSTQVSAFPFPRLDHDTAMILDVKHWPFVGALALALRGHQAMSSGQTTREVGFVLGACLALRREAILDVGILDLQYFFFYEEVDLCWRLRQRGWSTVFIGEAEVVHLGGASWAKVPARRLVWYYAGALRFYRLHAARPRYMILRAVHVIGGLGHIVYFLVRRHPQDRPYLSAYARILANAVKG